jgi:hypothetical protein
MTTRIRNRAAWVLGATLWGLLFAVACTRGRRIDSPSGEPTYQLTCRTPEKCFIRAAELCPQGYRLLDPAGQETGVSLYGARGHSEDYQYIQHRQLKIVCGAGLADEPESSESDAPRTSRPFELKPAPSAAESAAPSATPPSAAAPSATAPATPAATP